MGPILILDKTSLRCCLAAGGVSPADSELLPAGLPVCCHWEDTVMNQNKIVSAGLMWCQNCVTGLAGMSMGWRVAELITHRSFFFLNLR